MKVIEECHEAVHAMGCVSLDFSLNELSAPRMAFEQVDG